MFEDNVGEDGLSSQSTYNLNIEDPDNLDFLSPNPKMFNASTLSPEALSNMYSTFIKALNKLGVDYTYKK
jgi:hypothetical protein